MNGSSGGSPSVTRPLPGAGPHWLAVQTLRSGRDHQQVVRKAKSFLGNIWLYLKFYKVSYTTLHPVSDHLDGQQPRGSPRFQQDLIHLQN